MKVHINIDSGEDDSVVLSKDFFEAFRYVSAANIACGYHAGSKDIIARTTSLCLEGDVEIGLHPSYLDRENFGRVVQYPKSDELFDTIIKQLQFAESIVAFNGGKVVHVKPHGALYNQTAIDSSQCETVYQAIAAFDSSLVVYGLKGTLHEQTAKAYNLTFYSEGFGDRTYQTSYSLRSRSYPDSLLTDVEKVYIQVSQMINGNIRTVDDGICYVDFNTICIHGDNPNVISILKRLKNSYKIVKASAEYS